MAQSPVYWHPLLYRKAMQLAYGEHYKIRYEALSKFIPDRCQLLELCMGDAFFYLNYLKQKNLDYTCADINPVFVNAARKKGVRSSLLDVYSDDIPSSDHILMQASLYHFIPNEQKVIDKLLKACNKSLIISENVENLSNSASGFKSWLGEYLSKAKSGQSKIKFTRQTLSETFAPYKKHIRVWEETKDSKEVIIVLEKSPVL
jgi:hypothetical protein